MSASKTERRNLLFDGACAELAQAGCALLPMDYVELHAAATLALWPENGRPSMFLVAPVQCGKAILQVPSIGALLWWERCGRDWYADNDRVGIVAFAYVCHYGRDEKRIAALYNRGAADAAMFRFRMWLGTSCTSVDLQAALDRLDARAGKAFAVNVQADAEQDADGVSAAVWGDTVARLCAAYHDLTPHEVAFRLSPDEALALLRHAPEPYGIPNSADDDAAGALAKFQELKRRLMKERAPCSG